MQYYTADHYPYLPDEIKWGVRMCNRVAVRDFQLKYESTVREQIEAYLAKNMQHDLLGGNRELNLDLSVRECEYLFTASDEVKALAESGELAKLHGRCAELEEAVATGFLKVTDQFDRALQQISQSEEEVYESLLEKGLERVRSHNDASYLDNFTFNAGNRSVENLIIVQGSGEHAAQADVLRQLVGARAHILAAKCEVTSEFLAKVAKGDAAVQADLREYIMLRDDLVAAYDGDSQDVTGDAKIFKEQVD